MKRQLLVLCLTKSGLVLDRGGSRRASLGAEIWRGPGYRARVSQENSHRQCRGCDYNGPANGDDKTLGSTSMAIAGLGSVVVIAGSDGDYRAEDTRYDYALIKYVTLPKLQPTGHNSGFTNGQFEFFVEGLPGLNVVIEASTNLQQWSPIRTNVATTKPALFRDPLSSVYRTRFYRAAARP